jgi:hypothetical protein
VRVGVESRQFPDIQNPLHFPAFLISGFPDQKLAKLTCFSFETTGDDSPISRLGPEYFSEGTRQRKEKEDGDGK